MDVKRLNWSTDNQMIQLDRIHPLLKRYWILLVGILILASCSSSNNVVSKRGIQKRKHLKGWYIEKNNFGGNKVREDVSSESLVVESDFTSTSEFKGKKQDSKSTNTHETPIPDKLESECDQIVLKNGDDIEVIVVEITDQKVKYRLCSQPNGPLRSVDKNDILFIKYKDGSKETFGTKKEETSVESVLEDTDEQESDQVEQKDQAESKDADDTKIDPFAILGFIFGLVGLFTILFFFISPVFGIIATIFSKKSMKRIKENPDKWRGKQLATAGLVFGIIDMALLFFAAAILILFVIDYL